MCLEVRTLNATGCTLKLPLTQPHLLSLYERQKGII